MIVNSRQESLREWEQPHLASKDLPVRSVSVEGKPLY